MMVWKLVALFVVLVAIVLSISRWKVHPFMALLLGALSLGLMMGLGGRETVDVLLTGFGNTMKWIAILVILGAFIGEVLQASGGALRISDAVVRRVGAKKLPWAMGVTGYIVSIPVFVDVAYVILRPVTEALAQRARQPLLVIGLALTAGLTVSHTLIPPTPGPLAVASLLEANLGRLLLINIVVGVFAMTGGVIWASRYCGRFRLPQEEEAIEPEPNDLKEQDVAVDSSRRASAMGDLLPIIVPILLMGGGAFGGDLSAGWCGEVIAVLSIPMIAVLIGAAIAALQFKRLRLPTKLGTLVERAITHSALIVMITGAGGAFGHVIRQGGMPTELTAMFGQMPFLGFLLPFVVAAVLTTSTGSITVSLIGTASMLGPMAATLPYSPELMAAMIGAGSFCVFHSNSSFFWLLNQLHRVPVATLYRTFTMQSLVMGISGLLGVSLLYICGVR